MAEMDDQPKVSLHDHLLKESNPFLTLDSAGDASLNTFIFRFDIASDGCYTVEHGTNCTAACQNSSIAFKDISTIHNCVLYPITSEHLENDNFVIGDSDIAIKYGYMASSSVDLPGIKDTMLNCFNKLVGGNDECESWWASDSFVVCYILLISSSK